MKIFKIIESEITEFLTGTVQISEGNNFSQWKLVKRILIYLNDPYTGNKIDSQGNYKYWFVKPDPWIDSEVKNIDFDTKDILLYTDPPSMADSTPLFLTNAKLRRWLRDTGQGARINDIIEDGSSWGNVLLKKVKGDWEQLSFDNTYIINQVAKTVDETPVIERHEMIQSDLRAKKGIWDSDAVEYVIKECGRKAYIKKKDQTEREKQTENPHYEIYERNGEVSLADLKEAQGKKAGKGDDEKYVLAKIVTAGLKLTTQDTKDKQKILYADTISKMSDVYKEYHRGRYQGRWFRVGITELLFDVLTRLNYLGNEIAQAMEPALKIILKTPDKLTKENVLTDMLNCDIIKGDISQVVMQIPGLQAAVEEWNRLINLADRLTNSYEIVRGETLPSGTPFRLGALQNLNANKLYDFLREKMGLALESVIGEWIVPELIKELKTQEVMELTGDKDFMDRYYKSIAKAWYVKNLIQIGPHSKAEADMLIDSKVKELQDRPISLIKYEKEMLVGFKPKTKVVISGENIRHSQEMESWGTFIKLESDIVRRSAMIEKAMMLALPGVDIAGLPKGTPEQLARKSTKVPAGAPATVPAPTT